MMRANKDTQFVVDMVRYALITKATNMRAAIMRYRKELHAQMRKTRKHARKYSNKPQLAAGMEKRVRQLAINSRRLRRLEKQFESWRT